MGFTFQFLSRVAESRLAPAGVRRIAVNMQIGLMPDARLAQQLIDEERTTDAFVVIAGLPPGQMKSELYSRTDTVRARHDRVADLSARARQGVRLSVEEEKELDASVGKIKTEDHDLSKRFRAWVHNEMAEGRMDGDITKLAQLKRELAPRQVDDVSLTEDHKEQVRRQIADGVRDAHRGTNEKGVHDIEEIERDTGRDGHDR